MWVTMFVIVNANNVRKTLAETSYKIFCPKIKNLIAVTGTNGKSSICNFYFQILNIPIYISLKMVVGIFHILKVQKT